MKNFLLGTVVGAVGAVYLTGNLKISAEGISITTERAKTSESLGDSAHGGVGAVSADARASDGGIVVKFIFGFLVGLVSGIGLFLGPIVAFIGGIAIGWKTSSESSDEPQADIPNHPDCELPRHVCQKRSPPHEGCYLYDRPHSSGSSDWHISSRST